jgi:hypothetical protein
LLQKSLCHGIDFTISFQKPDYAFGINLSEQEDTGYDERLRGSTTPALANTSAAFSDQGGVENVMAAKPLLTGAFCSLDYSRGGNAHEQWLFLMWRGLGSFCSTIELHPRSPHLRGFARD